MTVLRILDIWSHLFLQEINSPCWEAFSSTPHAMEVSTTGFWSHSEWNLKSSLRFTNRALAVCDPSTPPLPDASLPSPASMLLAHSAPATLPFFLFLKMAKHSPGLKPVPWGDSPSSCDSFPYFLQVSAQNPPLPWGFPWPQLAPSSSLCFILLHSLSPLTRYPFSSAPSTANTISLRTGTNKYLAHIRLPIHQT